MPEYAPTRAVVGVYREARHAQRWIDERGGDPRARCRDRQGAENLVLVGKACFSLARGT
jgi:hypothetical protein